MRLVLPLDLLFAAIPSEVGEADSLAWLQDLHRRQPELSLDQWQDLAAEHRARLRQLLEQAVAYYAAQAARSRAGVSPAGRSHQLLAEFLSASEGV